MHRLSLIQSVYVSGLISNCFPFKFVYFTLGGGMLQKLILRILRLQNKNVREHNILRALHPYPLWTRKLKLEYLISISETETELRWIRNTPEMWPQLARGIRFSQLPKAHLASWFFSVPNKYLYVFLGTSEDQKHLTQSLIIVSVSVVRL